MLQTENNNTDTSIDFILIIDDDEATVFFHRIMAEEAEVCPTVYTAKHAQEGLDIFRDVISRNPVSKGIVFVDINMPVINGWEFLEQLRPYWEKLAPQIKIIMQSSIDDPRDLEKINIHPMVHKFVPKPLSPEVIRAIAGEFKSI